MTKEVKRDYVAEMDALCEKCDKRLSDPHQRCHLPCEKWSRLNSLDLERDNPKCEHGSLRGSCRICELEAKLRMKQDDWLKECKENDALTERVRELETEHTRCIRHINRLAMWAQQDPAGPIEAHGIKRFVLSELKAALGGEYEDPGYTPSIFAFQGEIEILRNCLQEEGESRKSCSEMHNALIQEHNALLERVRELEESVAHRKREYSLINAAELMAEERVKKSKAELAKKSAEKEV